MQNNLMECASYRPLPSLQKLSLIKVITIICNNKQLLSLITKCTLPRTTFSCISSIPENNWIAIKVKADQLISQIHIGVALKKKILEYLWPVSYKIILWKSIFAKTIGYKFLRHFYWTDQGRINNTKTIQYIILEKRISTRKRFILACSVCLVKEIRDIWGEMSSTERDYFYTVADRYYIYTGAHKEISLVISFWARSLGGSDDDFKDSVMNGAICAAQNGLLEAFKYFFSISTADARMYMSTFCMRFFSGHINRIYFLTEDEVDLGYLLFFEMSDENKKTFFNIYPNVALSLFLYSTEEKHFLSLLAEKIQNDLDLQEQYDIEILIMQIFYEYYFEVRRNFDYGILIHKIWGMITEGNRNFIKSTNIGAFILLVLMRDNFSFLLKKDAPVNVSDILSCNEMNMSGKPFRFNRSKLDFLQFLIRERIVTIYTLKKYRKRLSQHVCMNNYSWKKIVMFVNKMQKSSNCK